MSFISKKATIGKNVKFGNNVTILDNVIIKDNSIISHGCIIGDTDKNYFTNDDYKSLPTVIEEGSFIRPYSIISQGVSVGENFQCGDKVLIRSGSKIGKNCSIGTLCDLQGDLVIGDNTRLHSSVHVGMKTVIKDHVWIYPYVVFTNDPCPPKGVLVGSEVGSYSQICTGTIVLPGVKIGNSCFIGAASLINRDIGDEVLAFGSPASTRGSVKDIKDLDGNTYLPWQNY